VVVCHNPADKKYLKQLLGEVKETCHLLSSSEMKSERERMVCRAFLRCAGIPFTEEEIIASKVEPPDVLFDSARFEVRELMDADRQRHREWKKEVQRVEKAKSIDDVWCPPLSPKRIMLKGLISLVTDALKDKSERYGKRSISCGNIDALVYVNLLETYLVPASPKVNTEEVNTENLETQGWRSVSILVLFSPTENPDFQGWPCHHAGVLTATPTAPQFIRERAGKILNSWPNQEMLFEP
jgi:hypothetical protein